MDKESYSIICQCKGEREGERDVTAGEWNGSISKLERKTLEGVRFRGD